MSVEKMIDLTFLYEEIYRVLPTGSIQKLMEACYRATGIPILCVDITYNLLGFAPADSTGDYLWDYLVEHRGYEPEHVKSLYEEGIIQSVDTHKAPYLVDWGSWKDSPKIQGIVRVNNIVEGYVTMNCRHTPVTPDKMRAMEIIQNVCAYFFKRNNSESNMDYTYQRLFARDLFNNLIKTQKQLEAWFRDMNCKFLPPYVLAAVSTYDKGEKNVLSYLRKASQKLNPHQILLIQNDILYMLTYSFKTETTANLKSFSANLNHVDAKCGISETFDSLLDLSDYQYQAEAAMEIGRRLNPEASIYYYSDYALPAILLPRRQQMSEINFTPRAIRDMAQYDKDNGTLFLHTLRCYVKNAKNTLDTANELHIHRNTLLYRIGKIRELFGLSLDDYQTLLHLMIVFYADELT